MTTIKKALQRNNIPCFGRIDLFITNQEQKARSSLSQYVSNSVEVVGGREGSQVCYILLLIGFDLEPVIGCVAGY